MSEDALWWVLGIVLAALGVGILCCVRQRWRFTLPGNRLVLVAWGILGAALVLAGYVLVTDQYLQ